MRVLLPDGEEKQGDAPFNSVSSASAVEGEAAGLAAPSEQRLPAPSRSPNVPTQQDLRAPPREASTEFQPSRTNGKQRPATASRPGVSGSESSTDNVGLEGNVKDDGRGVDGKSSTATPEGSQAAAGTSACDVATTPSISRSGTDGVDGESGSGVLQTGGLSVETSAAENGIEKAFERSLRGGGGALSATLVQGFRQGYRTSQESSSFVGGASGVRGVLKAELSAKGWILRRQEGDGNCLFRAISQQIYGDPGMHGDIRRQCLDFMRKERDHYSQFVSEAFDSYVSRKEKDGVHGNNPEMQAASELFNRPIEVYVPEKGTVPINIFHGGYRSGNAPIRVSYHGGNHYNAVIDPKEASVGQGLGIPGLSKEAAEKESLKRALAQSCSSAHQVFPGGSATFFKDSFGSGFGESDLMATEEELEQAAIKASLADFRGTAGSGGGSSTNDRAGYSVPNRGGRGVGLASSGRLVGRGTASRGSAGRGERRGGGAAAWTSGAGSPAGNASGAGRVERGGWIGSGGGGEGGGSSGTSARKRRRPGSPPGESSRKTSPSSADGSTSSAVREMVWSYGFPLARVLQAHDLVGDSVEDMLVLLTSDAFQPPQNNSSDAPTASFSNM